MERLANTPNRMEYQRSTRRKATLRALDQTGEVTIPQEWAVSPDLCEADKVNLEVEAERLVTTPAATRKYTLPDLLTMQGNKPLQIDSQWDAMC